MRENTDQKNSEYGHFSRSVYLGPCQTSVKEIFAKKKFYSFQPLVLFTNNLSKMFDTTPNTSMYMSHKIYRSPKMCPL